jgi:hypothetical protein
VRQVAEAQHAHLAAALGLAGAGLARQDLGLDDHAGFALQGRHRGGGPGLLAGPCGLGLACSLLGFLGFGGGRALGAACALARPLGHLRRPVAPALGLFAHALGQATGRVMALALPLERQVAAQLARGLALGVEHPALARHRVVQVDQGRAALALYLAARAALAVAAQLGALLPDDAVAVRQQLHGLVHGGGAVRRALDDALGVELAAGEGQRLVADVQRHRQQLLRHLLERRKVELHGELALCAFAPAPAAARRAG